MGTAACALTSAIIQEAETRGDTPERRLHIAVELALAGWRPSSPLTREARIIVARHYEQVKKDQATANLIIEGHRDGTAEVLQAKAAMRRAFEISANWFDNAEGDRTGVRLIEVMERESVP